MNLSFLLFIVSLDLNHSQSQGVSFSYGTKRLYRSSPKQTPEDEYTWSVLEIFRDESLEVNILRNIRTVSL